ncbi:hypothetical protein TNCV_2001231 [Trichonephila clavipes]|nr:hypothetical protein TNCV_2001231 [Trichonephila clavipes]
MSPGTPALYRLARTLSCVPVLSRRVSPSQIPFISLEGRNFRMEVKTVELGLGERSHPLPASSSAVSIPRHKSIT